MPVIQGGGITYDRGAGTRENIALLQQALQNAQTNKYNRGVLALQTASQAMDMLNKEIERSGMPPSVFMSRGLGNDYLDTAMQGLSVASNRILTGDEARAAVNKLVTVAYDWNSIPVADRTRFLAGTFGATAGAGTKPTTEVQPETKPEPKIPFQKAADVLTNRDRLGTTKPYGGNESTGGYGGTQGLGGTVPYGGNESTGGYTGTLGATQGVADDQTFGGFQGSGGPLNETVNFGAQQALPPMTGISMPPSTTGQGPSPTMDAQKPTPQTDLQQIIEWAKVGQAVVQQAQRPQPPTTGSEDLQAQFQPQAPQQAYPPMTGTYGPTAPQVAQAEAIPAAAAGPQLAQPPMTGTYGPAGPVGQRVGATQGTPLSAPQGNLEQLLQLAQIGKQYAQAQQQAQQAPQPTGAAPRVLPSEQQMAQRQAMSEGQTGVQMVPQTLEQVNPAIKATADKIRELAPQYGIDMTNKSDEQVISESRSMYPNGGTKTLYDTATEVPTLPGQEDFLNILMSKAGGSDYQSFEQGLLAKDQRVAQATPTGGVRTVDPSLKELSTALGYKSVEEAQKAAPGIFQDYQNFLATGMSPAEAVELAKGSVANYQKAAQSEAMRGTPVAKQKASDILTKVANVVTDVKGTQVPATNVKQAAQNNKAAATAQEVAKASSMDKLFYSNVPSVNDVPAPGPNWLERNTPKVVKAMDEFRSVLGEPTSSFKTQSTAFRAGKEAGSFLNAVWNKMDAQEKASYMQALMEHARSADLTETFFTYGKEFSDSKLVEMGYKAEMMNAAAQSQTAQAKMLGDMMAAASKNIGDTLNSMSDFVAAVVPQAKAAGEKSVDAYIAKNTTLWNLYEGYKKFLAGLAENSGMNLMFGEIYRTQKTGWFGTKKFEITEETPFTKGLDKTKMSPEMQSLIGKYGL